MADDQDHDRRAPRAPPPRRAPAVRPTRLPESEVGTALEGASVPTSTEEPTAVEQAAQQMGSEPAPPRRSRPRWPPGSSPPRTPDDLQRIVAPGAQRTKLQCPFKAAGVEYIDYKDTETLKRYVNEQGKILPPPDDRRLGQVPAPAHDGHQAGPPRGAAPVRRRQRQVAVGC